MAQTIKYASDLRKITEEAQKKLRAEDILQAEKWIETIFPNMERNAREGYGNYVIKKTLYAQVLNEACNILKNYGFCVEIGNSIITITWCKS